MRLIVLVSIICLGVTAFWIAYSSYVFGYREQIPRALLEKRYSFDDFSAEEAGEAFEYSLDLLTSAEARANVFAARVMMHIHRDDWAGGRMELERIRAAGTPLAGELAVVFKLLEDHVA